ncbi:peroxynitrite isomerase THAP4 [Oncorhynchus keta]|uniref:peroxynitrite isomerase THAP4 n=1 Tax=Oncorhynchus keta TaxID=8018 RepID=UPI00227C018E|nr:peroxynitrite isomerase THAP4 [Oncorhynchus keta]
MPRECSVKTCDNKQKTWSALMFHRLPLSHPDRLKRWLIALNKDANTATDDLRKLLVCSEHFLPADYYEKLGQDRHSRMRIMKSFLKDTAVPSVAVHTPGQRGIISVETGDVPPGTDSLSAGGASGPTPQRGGAGVAMTTTGFLSHRGLQLTEPASTAGTYVALAPTSSLSKDLPSTTTTGDSCRRKKTKTNVPVTRRKKGQMDTAIKKTSVKHCTSMSSAAGSTSSPSTSSLSTSSLSTSSPSTSIPSTSSPSTSSSDSRLSSGEPDRGGGGWSERKWIVNESKLKELFQTCHQCGAALRNRTITALGYSQIKVTWTCPDEHRGEWQSCPDAFGIGHYLQTVGYRVLLDSMNSQFVSHD